MPFNTLLLPLLGGYWFLHKTHIFRFRSASLSRYRLLFESAFFGFLFLTLSYGLLAALEGIHFFDSWRTSWSGLVPFEYTGTGLCALLIAGLAPFPINHFWNLEKSNERAILQHGDLLLILLFEAQSENRIVMITLASRKVYVGWVSLSTNLNPQMAHVSLLPTLSGYRDADTLEVKYTTVYDGIYEAILKKDPKLGDLSAKDFQVVLPLEEISTATPYSQFVTEEHFRIDSRNSPPESAAEDP